MGDRKSARSSPVAFLEDWFGCELNADLVDFVAHAPRSEAADQLDTLRDDFRAWVAARPRLPPTDGIRPYFPTRAASLDRQAVAGYPGHRAWYLDGDRAAEQALNALAHALLYCDSIAVDDHLALELDFLRPESSDSAFEEGRRAAAAQIAFYGRIADLAHTDVVTFVEPAWELHNVAGSLEYGEPLYFLAQTCPADLFNDAGATQSADDRWSDLMIADKLLVVGQRVVTAHDNHAMLHVPNRLTRRLLHRAVTQARSVLADRTTQEVDDQLRLEQLLELEVPRLGKLSIQDLLALRRGSDHLAEFRAALRRAFDRIAAARATGDYAAAGLLRMVHDDVEQAYAHLNAEAQSPSLRDRIQAMSWLRVAAVGMVGTGMGAAIDQLDVDGAVATAAFGAASAVAASGVGLMLRWMASRRIDRAAENYVAALVSGTA